MFKDFLSYLCVMKIYLFNGIDTLDESFIENCISFFPSWRKMQMLSYKQFKGKIQNALAYILLIKALIDEGIFHEMPEFYYNEHGKPYLKNYPNWHFNFSHSKNAVCCVIAKEEVGIDIEEVREYKEALARYSCSEKEMFILDSSDDKANEFYRLWTRKEAVFKLIGTGINKDIKSILDRTHINIRSEKVGHLWLSVAIKK